MSEQTKDMIPAGATVGTAVAVQPAGGEVAKTWFRGVPPEDKLNRMYGFAKAICNAAFISPVVRGDEASVFYLVSMAEDMGAQWTHGLRSIYPLVKRGRDGEGDQIRAGMQGDFALALLMSRKFRVKIKESTEEICTVWMQRPDELMEFEDSFTAVEAQKLNLLSKPNWSYRKDMLRWRAIMRVARIVAADVLGGLYLPDEIEDLASDAPRSANGHPEENPFKVTNAAMAGAGGAGAASPGNGAAAPKAEEAPATTQAEEAASVQPGQEKPKPATEKPAEEKARGRRKPDVIEMPKAETPKPEPPKPEPPKPEAAKPAETAKPAFQATDADLPANLAPKPQADRLAAVVSQLAEATQRDTMAVKEKVRDFIRAWLNIPKLPVPPNPSYETLLPVLESMARQYGAKLLADPTTTGLESGTGWNKLVRHIDQWNADAKAAALALAIERFPDGPDMVMDLIETFGAEDLADVAAFLQVYRVSKSAMKLKELGPAAKVVASWGLDLATATEAQVLSKLAAGGAVQPGQPSGELWQE